MKKYWIINKGGVLVGFTDNPFIIQELVKMKHNIEFDNIFIHPYNCNLIKLEEILKCDYFAEEIEGYSVLQLYRMEFYTTKDNKYILSSKGELYSVIQNTDCINLVASNVIKSLVNLTSMSKYIKDKNFYNVIAYITEIYLKPLLSVEYIDDIGLLAFDRMDIPIDIPGLMMILGHMSEIK